MRRPVLLLLFVLAGSTAAFAAEPDTAYPRAIAAGYNVVIHEFAHVLDMSNGRLDATWADHVSETIETAFALEDRVGVQLGPLVVNAFDSDGLDVPDPQTVDLAGVEHAAALTAAAVFRRRRSQDQAAQTERLTGALPLPQVHLPAVFAAGLGADDIGVLAGVLASGTTGS